MGEEHKRLGLLSKPITVATDIRHRVGDSFLSRPVFIISTYSETLTLTDTALSFSSSLDKAL